VEIPFTVEQFFDVFGTYNTAIWPVQILAYILGIVVLVLAFGGSKLAAPIVSGILGFFWIWMGIFYHIVYFSVINPAAWIFGILFILQGLLFLFFARPAFRFILKPPPVIGGCFILYAMAIYPFLGISFGHSYPKAPMFGVAPCPTTIFTFGILLWATTSVHTYLLVIPLLWSIVGMSAAVNLGVPQDYGLVVAGILGTVLILVQKAKRVAAERSVPASRSSTKL